MATEECPTDAELLYLDNLAAQMGAISKSNLAIANLMRPVRENPSVIGDQEFRAEFILNNLLIQASAKVILDLQPPTSRVRALDREAIKMAQLYGESMRQMAAAVDHQDLSALGKAVDMVQKANSQVRSGQREADFCA